MNFKCIYQYKIEAFKWACFKNSITLELLEHYNLNFNDASS